MMAERSIDELKRQYEAAVFRANQAARERNEAGLSYTEKAIADKLAEFASRGIKPGMKVRLAAEKWGGDKNYFEAGFLGFEAGYITGQARPIISKLNKDGTISKRKWSIYFSEIEPLDDGGQDAIAGEAA